MCAPEVLLGFRFSEASDVYMLGMVMWQMFSGCAALPFAEFGSREELEDALWEHKDALRPPLGREWDRRICDLIEEWWQYESERRPLLRAVVERLRELRSSSYAPPSPVEESEDSSNGSLNATSDNDDTLLADSTGSSKREREIEGRERHYSLLYLSVLLGLVFAYLLFRFL